MAGTEVGKRQEIVLAAGEFVAGIDGSASHHLISLFVESTFGKRIAAGALSVGPRFQADLPPELKAKLADITASTDGNSVSSIQFHGAYELEGNYPPPTLLATPRSRTRCASSRPVSPGISMSVTITSGLCCSISFQASWPSAALATTSMSDSRRSSADSAPRTMAWSSASNTRIMDGDSRSNDAAA